MPGLSVAADHQCEFDLPETRQQGGTPGRCTFRPRRQVSPFAGARETESHGQECNSLLVVKRVAIDPHPLAQAVATGVVKRQTGLVYFAARCLPYNQDAG